MSNIKLIYNKKEYMIFYKQIKYHIDKTLIKFHIPLFIALIERLTEK